MNYYDPKDFALQIFKSRYALHDNESWFDACDRVAGHVSMAENGDNIPKYRQIFSELLKNNLFMPGGRIWYGSGRPKGQLLNCFVVPTSDSREGWGKSVSDEIIISGTGGGLGVNFSPIRPRGSIISGSGGLATGSVSLMQIFNAAGEVIKAGGGRRTALMMCLGLGHGDIEEFLDVKLDKHQLNNANVSVVFDDDPDDFFKQVIQKSNFELKFQGKTVKETSANKLWGKIVSNALKGGEPGLLNGYLANKMNNIWYYAPLISTNPCGEIWLTAYDCCCLGALVLPRFIKNRELDFSLLKETIHNSVRFLDNVLTVNNYPLQEIKETCSNIRRIGLGVMGLSTMLLELGMKYNSAASLELVNKVMNFIKNCAYEASIELSKEKGSFPKFNADLFLKSGFCKTLKPTLRDKIKQYGIRNCALLTIAPTGTTSIVCEMDSGIEPSFGPAWIRKFRQDEELKSEIIIHPLLKKMLAEKRSVKHFQSAYDLQIEDHFEMQRICQRHLDNACSKTINLPPGTSEKKLSELYMEYFPELKGVTVYPEGGRENQPVTPLSLEEALKYIDSDAKGALSDDNCKNGVCDI